MDLTYHFFEKTKPNVKSDPASFFEQLRELMNDLKPVPSSNHDKRKLFVHKDMDSCTHVFIRHDGVKKSLQSNYDGPFEVIFKNSKYFTVKVKGKNKNISLDRLKPMFIANDLFCKKQPSTLKVKKVRFAL